jgi:hypothetical protein
MDYQENQGEKDKLAIQVKKVTQAHHILNLPHQKERKVNLAQLVKKETKEKLAPMVWMVEMVFLGLKVHLVTGVRQEVQETKDLKVIQDSMDFRVLRVILVRKDAPVFLAWMVRKVS